MCFHFRLTKVPVLRCQAQCEFVKFDRIWDARMRALLLGTGHGAELMYTHSSAVLQLIK